MATPEGLAALFRQPDVVLPRAGEAKEALRALQLGGARGFETLLAQDPSARRKALEDAYYTTAASDIDYSADRTLRDVLEGQNAKNMLASTATGDYFVEPVERARLMAKERARNTAFTTAGQDVRAETDTQLRALGEAFGRGTTGLQGEANVEFANRAGNQQATQTGFQTGLQMQENEANRAQREAEFARSLGQASSQFGDTLGQRESEFGRTLGQREGEFGRSLTQQGTQFGQTLEQQRALQEKAFQNARDISSNANLAGGLGAGLGGLASLFGPQGLGTSFLKTQFPRVFGA